MRFFPDAGAELVFLAGLPFNCSEYISAERNPDIFEGADATDIASHSSQCTNSPVLARLRLLSDILRHPLNQGRKLRALQRFVSWQIGCRLLPGPAAFDFVGQSRLLVRRGQSSSSSNLYLGLAEFEDMAFVLHFLRDSDIFVDVGANIGSYTVLASAVRNGHSIAVEPVPSTFEHLLDNIRLNNIAHRVESVNCGVGAGDRRMLRFVRSRDAKNCVATDESDETVEVTVLSLDEIVRKRWPSLLKVDVEGFEAEVVAGGHSVLSCESLKAIIVELLGHGVKYGFDDRNIHRRLVEYGFAPFSYSPFNRELTAMDGINQHARNTLYVRDLDYVQSRVTSASAITIYDKTI